MIKKGGIFLGILLCFTTVYAQDNTADLFRPDNPNLVNLNEPTEYTGQPLVYIEGVKAPEKAHNEIEALQIKMFGTKNIREVTKDTTELSAEPSLPPPQNQELNFTIETPFHQAELAGFIPHIPDLTVMIQVLDDTKIIVTEQVNVVNTEENNFWNRDIPLPANSTAILDTYYQNNQETPVLREYNEANLLFKSTAPLEIGPNKITLKYLIENPFVQTSEGLALDLDITGLKLDWNIERMNIYLSVPQKTDFLTNRLLFGTNKMEIPDAYTQQTDINGNTSYILTHIIPKNASIQIDTVVPADALKAQSPWHFTNLSTKTLLLIILSATLFFYWLLTALWEYRTARHITLKKVKIPRSMSVLAYQMKTQLTPQKWQMLLEFALKNNLPLTDLQRQQNNEKNPQKTKAALLTFIKLMTESILGTAFLLVLGITGAQILKDPFGTFPVFLLILVSICVIFVLYFTVFKPLKYTYWQRIIDMLHHDNTILALTTTQLQRFYPLIIISGNTTDWHKKIMYINPNIAKEIHLTKGETK